MSEPTQVVQGDTVSWTRTVNDYRSDDGWTLTYYLASATASLPEIVATPDGSGGYEVTVAATETSLWGVETYRWQARVTKTTEAYTVATGRMDVLRAVQGAELYDDRRWAERVLEAIEATLAGKATADQQSYSVGGRQISRYTVEELLTWRDKMKREVAQLERADRIAAGLDSGATIRVRL